MTQIFVDYIGGVGANFIIRNYNKTITESQVCKGNLKCIDIFLKNIDCMQNLKFVSLHFGDLLLRTKRFF